MNILVLIIVVNAIGALLWYIINRKKGRDGRLILLFLLIPVFGYLLYYLPRWWFYLRSSVGYDRDSLVNRIHIDKAVEELDLQEAYSVVPVQDVLLHGNNHEKRKLLLNQLKKGIDSSYQIIRSAEADSDSESVHYVSAARMELYNKWYQKLDKARNRYEENIENEVAKAELFSCLSTFISSNLLQNAEKTLYMEQFCSLFADNDRTQYVEAYNDYLVFLCELNEKDGLYNEINEDHSKIWTYETYKRILNYLYEMGEKERFYGVVTYLRNSKLVLDNEGIQLIRYWQTGGQEHAVH